MLSCVGYTSVTGGMMLSYVELYEPQVLGRVGYYDCPNLFT